MIRTGEREPEELESQLQDALNHLYDPTYQPAKPLFVLTGNPTGQDTDALKAAIIQAIEALKPDPETPPDAYSRRVYDLLFYRYIQGLTQEQASERLGITSRHLRRQQQQAVHTLAQHMFGKDKVEKRPSQTSPAASPASLAGNTTVPTRHSQIRREIEALMDRDPGMASDVAEAIRKVSIMGSNLTRKHGVELRTALIPPGCIVSTHPSVLHQVILTAIELVVQFMNHGQITLEAASTERYATITITGEPIVATRTSFNDTLLREILATIGGFPKLLSDQNSIQLIVNLPFAKKVTVLVVDDNADLVHFYRRYTTGTRYHIHHLFEGRRVFEVSTELKPDVIILDVMLPDVDGWELLMQIRDHPVTRSIPVVVCSVVGGKELSLSLGASTYIPKPVGRYEFIQALDQALNRAST